MMGSRSAKFSDTVLAERMGTSPFLFKPSSKSILAIAKLHLNDKKIIYMTHAKPLLTVGRTSGKEVDIPVFDDSIIKKSHAEILYNYEKLQFELHVFGSFGAFVQKGEEEKEFVAAEEVKVLENGCIITFGPLMTIRLEVCCLEK